MKSLKEICGNCGFTLGSHSSPSRTWPTNTCPATEGEMDFAQGPGTTFKPTGEYERIELKNGNQY